jgi:branched-chain amino acid transport system ATP-binding protein
VQLEVRDLAKKFGQLVVIESLSFHLEQGEALGIVGPNGAGKTTLLNLIAGDIAPDAGSVTFAGNEVTKEPSHVRCRRGIGRTSQIPRPFSGLTVFENVLVGSTFGSSSGQAVGSVVASERAFEALERTGLLARANLPAGSLTLLERKRLELARALATQPTLLLLDEIAGGLTEAEVHELVATIEGIRAEGVSIVWIEHIVHALLRVVDRILAIDAGKKLIEGDPHEVMASKEVRSVYLGDLAAENAVLGLSSSEATR